MKTGKSNGNSTKVKQRLIKASLRLMGNRTVYFDIFRG